MFLCVKVGKFIVLIPACFTGDILFYLCVSILIDLISPIATTSAHFHHPKSIKWDGKYCLCETASKHAANLFVQQKREINVLGLLLCCLCLDNSKLFGQIESVQIPFIIEILITGLSHKSMQECNPETRFLEICHFAFGWQN